MLIDLTGISLFYEIEFTFILDTIYILKTSLYCKCSYLGTVRRERLKVSSFDSVARTFIMLV